MADFAATPFCIRHKLQPLGPKAYPFISTPVYPARRKGEKFYGKPNHLNWVQMPKAQTFGAFICADEAVTVLHKKSSISCNCFGLLTTADTLLLQNWISIGDQVLLASSILFAYIAGIIPREKTFLGLKIMSPFEESTPSNTTSGGRFAMTDNANSKCDHSWDEVKEKLTRALYAHGSDISSIGGASELEDRGNRGPSSLFAVAEGPRLRLLCATLLQLRNEINGVSWSEEYLEGDIWLKAAIRIIKGVTLAVCMKWLKEELVLKQEDMNMKLLSRLSERLEGDNSMLQYIIGFGKAELYADLLSFLNFGSLRTGCYYDYKLLNQYAVEILEDLVIMLADGITNIYLELISVDGSMPDGINGLESSLCFLSTRELQRLRNEIVLRQWIQQNFESIVLMYEDRFDLFILSEKNIVDRAENQIQKLVWWKKLSLLKPHAQSKSCGVEISSFSLKVKRIKELKALTGWRYYFSLLLELSDIAMPLARSAFRRTRDAISFFLVYLIGGSLGLIYTGIRKSFRWR